MNRNCDQFNHKESDYIACRIVSNASFNFDSLGK